MSRIGSQESFQKRELHNLLRDQDSMISKSVLFFANRHNPLGLRRFAKNKTDEESANLGPNGVLQFPLKSPARFFLQSWWVFVFLLGCFFIYYQAMHKKAHVAISLQQQLDMLDAQKERLLLEHEDLVLQIHSQSDPAWIELTLMKGLGLVPDGQMKVFFQPEPKEPLKNGQAA